MPTIQQADIHCDKICNDPNHNVIKFASFWGQHGDIFRMKNGDHRPEDLPECVQRTAREHLPVKGCMIEGALKAECIKRMENIRIWPGCSRVRNQITEFIEETNCLWISDTCGEWKFVPYTKCEKCYTRTPGPLDRTGLCGNPDKTNILCKKCRSVFAESS